VTGPVPPPPPGQPEPQTRPVDVDTGFWLWLVAVPVMVLGSVADMVGSSHGRGSTVLYVGSGLFTAVLCAIVVTFLILMRAGYRWARTVLTGGGIATVVYVGTRLFTVSWPPMYAVICGVAGIVGSVMIAGGMFLLHRSDAHEYFTR
jgi:disulfide bond formation protein DsbB